jgi:hypothetical protein
LLKDSSLRLTSLCFEMHNTWSSRHFFIIFVWWDEYIAKYVLKLNNEPNKTILRSSLKLLCVQPFRYSGPGSHPWVLGFWLLARHSGFLPPATHEFWVLLQSSFFFGLSPSCKISSQKKTLMPIGHQDNGEDKRGNWKWLGVFLTMMKTCQIWQAFHWLISMRVH